MNKRLVIVASLRQLGPCRIGYDVILAMVLMITCLRLAEGDWSVRGCRVWGLDNTEERVYECIKFDALSPRHDLDVAVVSGSMVVAKLEHRQNHNHELTASHYCKNPWMCGKVGSTTFCFSMVWLPRPANTRDGMTLRQEQR